MLSLISGETAKPTCEFLRFTGAALPSIAPPNLGAFPLPVWSRDLRPRWGLAGEHY